jgi:hypothetical protein
MTYEMCLSIAYHLLFINQSYLMILLTVTDYAALCLCLDGKSHERCISSTRISVLSDLKISIMRLLALLFTLSTCVSALTMYDVNSPVVDLVESEARCDINVHVSKSTTSKSRHQFLPFRSTASATWGS